MPARHTLGAASAARVTFWDGKCGDRCSQTSRCQTRLLKVPKRPQRQRLQNHDDGERAATEHSCDQQKPVRPLSQRGHQADQARDEKAESGDEVSQRIEDQGERIQERRRRPEQYPEPRARCRSRTPTRRSAKSATLSPPRPPRWCLPLPTLFASTVVQQSSCQSVSVPQEFTFPWQFRGLGSHGPRAPRGLRRTAAVQVRCSTPQTGTRCLRPQDFGGAREGLISPARRVHPDATRSHYFVGASAELT